MRPTTPLFDHVRAWFVQKNITGPNGKGTVLAQLAKLDEEVGELKDAIAAGDTLEVADAIGDIQVVVIGLAEMLGHVAEHCLADAYEVIRQRTGMMINGTFVKDPQPTH